MRLFELINEAEEFIPFTTDPVTPNQYELNRLDIEITVLPVGKSMLLSVLYPFNLEGR